MAKVEGLWAIRSIQLSFSSSSFLFSFFYPLFFVLLLLFPWILCFFFLRRLLFPLFFYYFFFSSFYLSSLFPLLLCLSFASLLLLRILQSLSRKAVANPPLSILFKGKKGKPIADHLPSWRMQAKSCLGCLMSDVLIIIALSCGDALCLRLTSCMVSVDEAAYNVFIRLL